MQHFENFTEFEANTSILTERPSVPFPAEDDSGRSEYYNLPTTLLEKFSMSPEKIVSLSNASSLAWTQKESFSRFLALIYGQQTKQKTQSEGHKFHIDCVFCRLKPKTNMLNSEFPHTQIQDLFMDFQGWNSEFSGQKVAGNWESALK